MPDLRANEYDLSPMDEIELADFGVRESELDEQATMTDPDAPPKPPSAVEEGVTDDNGDMAVISPLTNDDDLLNFRR